MPALLASLARSLNHHWKRGLIGLVATIVLIGVIVGSQSQTAAEDFSIPGTESQEALDLLEAKFPQAAGAQSQIVFTVSDGTLNEAAGPELAGLERFAGRKKAAELLRVPVEEVELGLKGPRTDHADRRQ